MDRLTWWADHRPSLRLRFHILPRDFVSWWQWCREINPLRSILQFRKYKGALLEELCSKKEKVCIAIRLVCCSEVIEAVYPRQIWEELQLDSLHSERNQLIPSFRILDSEQALIESLSIKWWSAKILQLLSILTSKVFQILLDEPFAGLDDRASAIIFVSGWG